MNVDTQTPVYEKRHSKWLVGLSSTMILILSCSCNITQGTETAIPITPPSSEEQNSIEETPVFQETGSPVWEVESIPAECENRPLAAWRFQPGAYTIEYTRPDEKKVYSHIIDQYVPVEELDLSMFSLDLEYPLVSEYCSLQANLFANYIPQPPTPGLVYEWEGNCTQQSEVPHSVSQKWTITVVGYEERETNLGPLNALKTDSLVEVTEVDGIDGTSYEQFHAVSWFVCGLGLVYEKSDFMNLTNSYTSEIINELLSFSPMTTLESRVRYILADIELGQTADYYRANISDEETAEALRRWDAGIRVVNLTEFERKLVDNLWRVVNGDTNIPIEGSEIILSTDNLQ
jgi:hypothetical protein